MRDALGSVQSVLLLGGTSDIGLAMVRSLVADRARRVVLAARSPEAAEDAAGELRSAGADVAVVRFDAAATDAHVGAIADSFDRAGEVDLAIVAFGILGERDEAQLSHATELHQVNDVGAVSAMTEVARRMRAQGHGTIVLLSTVAAVVPRPANYAYGSSKAGADAFARGLQLGLHGSGVRVVIVRPGFVRTKMTRALGEAPMAVDPEQVAEVAIEAVRRGRPIVYVPSQLRWVMAALRLLPPALLRRLPG